MRSIVLLVSLAVCTAPVMAQSTLSEKTPVRPAHVSSVIDVVPATGNTGQKAPPKVRMKLQQALAKATAHEHGCFALKTYAPKGQKPSHHPASVERPYVPRLFALRSTCSPVGTFEMVPLSTPSASGK